MHTGKSAAEQAAEMEAATEMEAEDAVLSATEQVKYDVEPAEAAVLITGQVRDIEPVITVMEAGKKHVLPVAEMVICKGQTGGASDWQQCRGSVQRRDDCAVI